MGIRDVFDNIKDKVEDISDKIPKFGKKKKDDFDLDLSDTSSKKEDTLGRELEGDLEKSKSLEFERPEHRDAFSSGDLFSSESPRETPSSFHEQQIPVQGISSNELGTLNAKIETLSAKMDTIKAQMETLMHKIDSLTNKEKEDLSRNKRYY